MTLPNEVNALPVCEVGEWGPKSLPLCPAVRVDPEPCDCGYDGEWERRTVFSWYKPRRSTGSFSAAARVGGWKVIAGYDERCPGCHDVERFDHDATLLGSERGGLAEVVRLLHVS